MRTTAIDELVNGFLEDNEGQYSAKKQIISLGAGSDTRAFRIFSKRSSTNIIYHELDFPVNTSAKIRTIRSSPLLQRTIQMETSLSSAKHQSGDMTTPSITDDALHLPNYHIHPIDLRTIAAEAVENLANQTKSDLASGDPKQRIKDDSISTAKQGLKFPGVDPSLPTLLISECCLIYLSPNDADAVVDYFSQKLFPPTTPLGLIVYEPIRPDDPFGKTMVSNLAARGIQLQTLHKYSSLTAQRQRFLDHGLQTGQGAMDIDSIWNHWISRGEKERVATLEMLDEIEEWRLLAQHYCVAWGWRNTVNDSNFNSWNRLPEGN